MGTARAAALLMAGCTAASVLALGCAGDDDVSGTEPEPTELVEDAAEQTLSLDGFRIDGENVAGGDSTTYTVTYQAPDRARTVSNDGSITIDTGDAIYSSRSTEPESFIRIPADPDATPLVDQLLAPLRAVREAVAIERDGDRYVIDLPDYDGSIEVEVEDGFVTYLRMESENEQGQFSITQRLSEFGEVFSIEPPPADQVAEIPGLPECPPDDAAADEIVLCAPSEADR